MIPPIVTVRLIVESRGVGRKTLKSTGWERQNSRKAPFAHMPQAATLDIDLFGFGEADGVSETTAERYAMTLYTKPCS